MRIILKPGGVLVLVAALAVLVFIVFNDIGGVLGSPRHASATSSELAAAPEISTPEEVGRRLLPFRPINLTMIGSLDWAHWGLSQSPSALAAQRVVRKAGVTHRLGDVEFVGNKPGLYGNDVRSFSWSDGDAFKSIQSTQAGLSVSGVGNGFRLETPVAVGERRTMHVWVGGANAHGKLIVRLSDGTPLNKIEPVTIGSEKTGYSSLYTFKYIGTVPGQKVVLSYLLADGDGSISLQAAALE